MEIKQIMITTRTKNYCLPQSTVAVSDDFLAAIEGFGVWEQNFQDIAQRSTAIERIVEVLLLVVHIRILLLPHIFIGRQVSHTQA